jgi:hypothetical protein
MPAGPPIPAVPAGPGAPVPGRPLLGQGMMARYGQEPAAGPVDPVAEARRGLRWALLTVLALAAIAAVVKLL